jgi:hypothetical protein
LKPLFLLRWILKITDMAKEKEGKKKSDKTAPTKTPKEKKAEKVRLGSYEIQTGTGGGALEENYHIP